LKNAKAEDKKALAEEAIREIKERKKAQIAKRQGDKKTVNKEKQTAQKAQDKAAQKAQKKAAPKAKGGKWWSWMYLNNKCEIFDWEFVRLVKM